MAADFCVIQLEGWSGWWQETRRFRIQMYISIILFFLSAVLAYPIARSVFFLLRRATPKRWVWPDEARSLMMWQTALLCRAGLLWIALRVSRVSIFLCQWPEWLFGVCFIIWMDSVGNVLREVIVRKGVTGYTEDEKPGRLTLLYEGTTLAKMLLLVLVVYTYYIASFFAGDNYLRLLTTTGFFLAIALSVLPLLRNVLGAHYMFLNSMLRLSSHIGVRGDARGTISDAPLGFLVLESENEARTFVPAGGSVTSTTTVYDDQISMLSLDIHLPAEAKPSEVRGFVQELDWLAVKRGDMKDASPHSPTSRLRGLTLDSASQRDEEPSKRVLFDWDSKEQNEILDRARAHQHIIEISTSRRWIIHFKKFLRASTKDAVNDLRSKYIEEIIELKEQWLASHSIPRGVANW